MEDRRPDPLPDLAPGPHKTGRDVGCWPGQDWRGEALSATITVVVPQCWLAVPRHRVARERSSRSISRHCNGRSGSRRVVALAAQGDSSFLGGFYAGTA